MVSSTARSALLVAVGLAGLVLGACTPEDPGQVITALEYRWGDEGVWHPATTLRAEPPGRGTARRLTVRFITPPTSCIDPAVELPSATYLKQARVGDRVISDGFADGFIPYLPSEQGRLVELTFASSQNIQEGDPLVGCQSRLRTAQARRTPAPWWWRACCSALHWCWCWCW